MIAGVSAVILELRTTFRMEATYEVARVIQLKEARSLTSLELLCQYQLLTLELLCERKGKSLTCLSRYLQVSATCGY